MTDYPFERASIVHPAGTLLSVTFMGGLRHYGLATGYGTVIHSSRRFGRVAETDYAAFADNRRVSVIPYTSRAISGSQIVARARGRLGQRYNVLSRNCEHFITWAIEGRARSRQLGPADLGRRG